jgi:hypothetical protein
MTGKIGRSGIDRLTAMNLAGKDCVGRNAEPVR